MKRFLVSIREAGINADKLEAWPGDAASTDGHGYEQEGNETVVRLNQRNRRSRWSQKALDSGRARLRVLRTHPTRIPAEFATLPPSPNWNQERSNPVRALQSGSSAWSRCQPQDVGGGIVSEANAFP
jgi:hypothetical protein